MRVIVGAVHIGEELLPAKTDCGRREVDASFEKFRLDIGEFLSDTQIIDDPLRRVVFGADASFYRLVPRLVLVVEDETEVRRIIESADRWAIPVTFRAAGTSLSGQGVTDSVLVKLGHDGWRDCVINDDASLVRVGPGLTGGQVNARLKRFGRKIGPDPASINSAMIGGIAANNSSGMCCGIAQNSYQTLSKMRVVLSDGTVLDTSEPASVLSFRQSHAPLLNRLRELGEAVRGDAQLTARIKKKTAIKNTMGYAINALVDFEDPIDILQHLMIGSEGTLGFISQITYETVPDPRCRATALAFFPDIRRACDAVALLKATPVSAVELMDYRSLCSVRGKPGMPSTLETMPQGTAALLIDVQSETKEDVARKAAFCAEAISSVESLEDIVFVTDPAQCIKLWSMRKGLFPAVGAVRETGTTVVIEDVAVTTDQLADAVIDLVRLFEKHGYDEAIIFGHALEGNVHFVFTQSFATRREIDRYGEFMDDVTDLIVNKYDGSLKAEHSTGRNMAPFVEMEWGATAYALMREIKSLFDPNNILNPGVILNDDPNVHLADLKPMPAANETIDKCIECGFCEATCPSRALSLTPRQRIVGLRELARLDAIAPIGDERRNQIESDYAYQGVDTCAGDGLCSVACPVNIDTGQAMRGLRAERHGDLARFLAKRIASNFGVVCGFLRVGLSGVGLARSVLGDRVLSHVFRLLNSVTLGRVPIWQSSMPTAAAPMRRRRSSNDRRVVYFPSCAARVFGPAPDDPHKAPLPEVVQELFLESGFNVVVPDRFESLCCGMPFGSKGFPDTANEKRDELIAALRHASRDGRDPIVFDTSPCAMRVKEAINDEALSTFDLIEALDVFVLNNVDLVAEDETIALHTTCSARRMNLDAKFKSVAERLSQNVVAPPDIQCCGFAGDKGFNVPELNRSALRTLSGALPEDCHVGYSTSRTCEIGLSTHAGRSYQSIAYLAHKRLKENKWAR